MNIPTFSSDDFITIIPAGILVGTAIFLMLSEVFLTSKTRTYQSVVATLACAFAGVVSLQSAFLPARSVLQGFAVLDPFSSFLTVVVCLGTGLAVMLSSGFLRHRNAERGEFYALLLFSAAGMSLLALSAEFVTLFVNLEVMSLATYALTSYLRRGPRPAEAVPGSCRFGAKQLVMAVEAVHHCLRDVVGNGRVEQLGKHIGRYLSTFFPFVFMPIS